MFFKKRISKIIPQWSLHPLRFPQFWGTETFFTIKEGSTFLAKPLFNGLYTPFGSPVCGGRKPQEREDVTALRCSEPLRYKVGGPIKGLAIFVRDGTAWGYGMIAGISAYVLYQITQNVNLNENYSSIDAMKLSKLSTRTTPAS